MPDSRRQFRVLYRHFLLRLVDFDGYRGQMVLEVGCGAGVDLARFAKGGARVTGVDPAPAAPFADGLDRCRRGQAGGGLVVVGG